jgi:hypothetical protein
MRLRFFLKFLRDRRMTLFRITEGRVEINEGSVDILKSRLRDSISVGSLDSGALGSPSSAWR